MNIQMVRPLCTRQARPAFGDNPFKNRNPAKLEQSFFLQQHNIIGLATEEPLRIIKMNRLKFT